MTKFLLPWLICILLVAFLSGMPINLVASVGDSTVKRKFIAIYKTPRSAMFYQAYGKNIFKQALIIGSIEIQDNGFRFTAWNSIEGWPQDLFEKKFALNNGFREIFILYADIKSIRYNGRILLRNGARHVIFGTHRKPSRAIYLQIKARVDTVQKGTD
jgi:hypothetical protein